MLLLPAAFPAAAQAHANLLRTDPAAGSVVANAPAQIVLHFDQQVRDVASTVTNDQGDAVTSSPAHTAAGDVRALVIPLALRPARRRLHGPLAHRLDRRAHHLGGLRDRDRGGQAAAQAAEVQTAALDWPFLIARFAYFCGLALVIGGVVFRAVVWRPVVATLEGQPRAMADLRERIRATQLFTIAAVLMLAGGWAALTRQGAEVAGVSFWEAFDHRGPVASAIQATRFGREFGRGIDLAAIFCVCAASAFAIVRRSRLGAAALAVPAVVAGRVDDHRAGPLGSRRRPWPRGADDHGRRAPRRRGGGLDRRAGAARRRRSARHARARGRCPRPGAAPGARPLLDARAGLGHRHRRDRRRARSVGGRRSEPGVVDGIRPDADREVGALRRADRARIPKPACARPVHGGASQGRRRARPPRRGPGRRLAPDRPSAGEHAWLRGRRGHRAGGRAGAHPPLPRGAAGALARARRPERHRGARPGEGPFDSGAHRRPDADARPGARRNVRRDGVRARGGPPQHPDHGRHPDVGGICADRPRQTRAAAARRSAPYRPRRGRAGLRRRGRPPAHVADRRAGDGAGAVGSVASERARARRRPRRLPLHRSPGGVLHRRRPPRASPRPGAGAAAGAPAGHGHRAAPAGPGSRRVTPPRSRQRRTSATSTACACSTSSSRRRGMP